MKINSPQKKSYKIYLINSSYNMGLVCFEMMSKCCRLYKCFPTLITFMPFITGMSSFMNYQMLSLHKHFLTVGTLVILYTSVDSHMISIDTMKSEGFITLFTLIRFLPSMFLHMLFQIVFLIEALTTEVAKESLHISWDYMFR